MARQDVRKALEKVAKLDFQVEFPEREEHGDFSTNLALIKAQKEDKNPREAAESLVEKLKRDKELKKIVSKIEVAGPGFINFWLSKNVLTNNLNEILESGDRFGASDLNRGKKVMFEYGQPNTHKLPHVGHLFSYIYGESMSRIMEASGWSVKRVNYQGDVGPHVAKCLWKFIKDSPKVPGSLTDKVVLLQKMYQEGSRVYDENEKARAGIDKLNIKIYEGDESIETIWQKTRQWSLDYYKRFEKRLGINFDKYYFESEVSEPGKEKVKELLGKMFKESQGAIIFEGSKYGLHDRVFVTKNDTPTYEAKDFYLQELKMKDWPADLLVISTAREQNKYFEVVFKALELAHSELKGKLKHIGFGMVNLKGGKLSSRRGEIMGAVELIDIVVDRLKQMSDSQEIAEVVGLGAVKYSFLKNNPLQDIVFDIEESIKVEGNSGPYLQYTVVRTNSVLRRAGLQPSSISAPQPTSNLNAEESVVLRGLVYFPEVIERAAKRYSPNLLCNYLFDLARRYNSFYNKHRVINPEARGKRQEVKKFRVALTAGVGQVLKNGLRLLGIEAPERM